MPTVCVVGAGRMASALTRSLLRQGHSTYVWNRTLARAQSLADAGAKLVSALPDAIGAADIVVVNVIDYAAADTVLRAPATVAALDGRLLVQLTSGSPRQARETGEWAGRHRIRYLDGAIMATPNVIGDAEATILYSGPRAYFDESRDLLLSFGGGSSHVGDDYGHASALDTALLSQLWGALFGTLQGIALSQAEKIDLDTYRSYLRPFKPIIDGAADDLVARVRDSRLGGDEQTLAAISAHYAAFQHLLELTAEHGLNGTIGEAFDSIFRSAIAGGHIEDDFASLSKFMR